MKKQRSIERTEAVTDKLIYLNMYFGDYMEAARTMSENFYISRLSSNK